MFRKLPAGMLIAALLISVPSVWAVLHPNAASASGLLTPGTASAGLRSVEERVDFWTGRIAGETDHLNRVHAGAALLELARQSGDLDIYKQALTMADAALNANPTGNDARVLRAASLSSAHRFDEALVDALAVLAVDPTSFQARSVAGDALLELRRFDEARVHLDALVAAQPEAPAVLARQAEFAWDTEDSAAAVAFGERALLRANEAGLSPGELSFYAIRAARFRLDTGDVSGAHDLTTAVLEIAPEVPAVHSTLGAILRAEGCLKDSAVAYETAAAIAPLREALVALVELHKLLGHNAKSADWQLRLDALGPPPIPIPG